MRSCSFLGWMMAVVATVLGGATQKPLVTAVADCPLDLSWSNFTLATSVCSNPSERGLCCRHLSAFVAVSVARYANVTGKLGVPPAFSAMCVNYVTDILKLHGIPSDATIFCGLGSKILVTYQCKGRTTVLEMLQSPSFNDVVNNCKIPLNGDISCKRCLNSAILYLHHLIASDDNVTLSICRDAAFVSLINQGDQVSTVDKASCFFGVEPDILPGFSPPLEMVNASPGTIPSDPPTQNLVGMPAKKSHQSYRFTLIQGVGIAITGLAILLLVILIPLICKKNKELKAATSPGGMSWKAFPSAQKCQKDKNHMGPPSMFKRFSYKDTKNATCNFSSVIGKGGFGTVFKAQFKDGTMAAVKRMNKVSEQGEDEFCREMEILGRLHHRHLVFLRGFCVEKQERFLVYEYMENGSLKDHLHSPGRIPLSWETRMQIAIDVANALEYLHFFCDPPLCHRDIKSSNILLDENFAAKIADFGLAHASRSGSISFGPVNTGIRGRPGYMDPEYMTTQELTEKSDIYSYGVLLLELVTGRRAIQDNINLVNWSQKFMMTYTKYPDMVDPLIADQFDSEQLQVLVEIIQWCTLREGRERPSIKQVLRILYERLDKIPSDHPDAMNKNIQGGYGTSKINKDKYLGGEAILHNGDARCLMSSSSTSRSYCSQSILLESVSTQSPPVNF